jgi:hypothetical protein
MDELTAEMDASARHRAEVMTPKPAPGAAAPTAAAVACLRSILAHRSTSPLPSRGSAALQLPTVASIDGG